MPTNIYAYTPPGSYMPPYISINHDAGYAVVTVRGCELPEGSAVKFPQADIQLPITEIVRMAEALNAWLVQPDPQ